MAVVDPYSPCPCGSGQKFKWCCHKVEAFAERSQRYFEGGQYEAAIQALDEGLKKEKNNAWLLTRKSFLLLRQGRPEEAKACLRAVLEVQPKHFGAQVILTRLLAQTEGAAVAAAQFQRLLDALPGSDREKVWSLAHLVGVALAASGDTPAALKHLRLAGSLGAGAEEPAIERSIRGILRDEEVSPWLKNEEGLLAAPEGASGPAAARFAEALALGDAGRWSAAAAEFERLTADPEVGPRAWRNLGFCRLWLADDPGAAEALRKYAASLGDSAEAVDIEALCQQLVPESSEAMVEHVQLRWPLRIRDQLLATLKAEPTIVHDGTAELDPSDPESPEAEQFSILGRPDPFRDDAGNDGSGLTIDRIPEVLGRILVGPDVVVLDSYDDGRLDGLADRFTAMAGTAIAPAHPRTKVLSKIARRELALSWSWHLPEATSAANYLRLMREKGTQVIREIWPETPIGALRGRTPLQAAAADDAAVALRAAVLQLEASREAWREGFDFDGLRERLRLRPEPALDPEAVDPSTVHLSRLSAIPAERLGDEKLLALFDRAHETNSDALEPAARALVSRPGLLQDRVEHLVRAYTALAMIASRKRSLEEAMDWVRRARQAAPAASRAVLAPIWDVLELRLRSAHEAPEAWVPELAVLMERYEQNPQAIQHVMACLIEMGLIEVEPDPENPGEFLLDSRRLQAVLSRYGPRVTTATGRLGVSAARPEIWTPGSSAAGGGGAIWTPGSSGGGGTDGGGKKLIIQGG